MGKEAISKRPKPTEQLSVSSVIWMLMELAFFSIIQETSILLTAGFTFFEKSECTAAITAQPF